MKLKYITIILTALLFTSCNKFLDIRPTGMVIPESLSEYRALLTSVYNEVPNDRYRTDLRSDDVKFDISTISTTSSAKSTFFEIWNWTDENRDGNSWYFGWQNYYHILYIANYVIEHKSEIKNASIAEINQIVGESYMLRAYMHFLLVNLYSPAYTSCDTKSTRGIPLQLKADVKSVLRCSSVDKVYKKILEDLDLAEDYMNVDKWEAGYNYRFSKITANALRARVALYMGNWQLAFDEAEKVIAKYPTLVDFNSSTATMPNNYVSVESILALEHEDLDFIAVLNGTVNNGFMSANAQLIGNYEKGDLRYYDINDDEGKGLFFSKDGSRSNRLYFFKPIGRDINEFRCTFRASEFYLIAAEAANENNSSQAKEYLKELIKNRYTSEKYSAKSSDIDAMSQDELRVEIANERRREFAFQGHRWFDLRRTTQPEIVKEYTEKGNKETYTLQQNDSRYTLRFPTEAVAANPELEIWSN